MDRVKIGESVEHAYIRYLIIALNGTLGIVLLKEKKKRRIHFNELNLAKKLRFPSFENGRILLRVESTHEHTDRVGRLYTLNCIPVHQQTGQTGWPPTGSFNRKQPDERGARDLLRITAN